MAERIVAADASPLIGLASAGAFDLLRELFNKVTVTAAVRDEVMAGGALAGAQELEAAIRAGWIEVIPDRRDPEFANLGPGESSTLAFAKNHPETCLVLMDDPLGRSHARTHGLVVTGVAGVLLAARRAGFVHAIAPFFERLKRGDFRLSGEIVRAVLEQAGET